MAARGDRSEASAMDEEEEMVEYNHGSAVKKRAKREGDAAAHPAEAVAVAEEEEEDYGGMSVERVFDGKPVPPWQQQLTFRAFVVSFFLSIIFSIIVMKLNLTTGIIPSLNVSAGLLGFFFVKVWTVALDKCGLLRQPFTRQENTVIQTCVVASSGIAFSG